ncbi:MAG TPA: cell wall-binding repeat-containing protein, partial [Candidatus Dormibacteraeota bacterium]|nr:cell wall-binding repeat-containing protein [Candidatus Dormibacteraeota bacterium]
MSRPSPGLARHAVRPIPRSRRDGRWRLVAALVTLALLSVAWGGLATPISRAAPSSLPPLPRGWPLDHLAFGLADSPGGAAHLQDVAPFDLRYQYLAGGVNTGAGWQTWNANGQFVTWYVQDSVDHDITPVFSYYMLRQSHPGDGMGESAGDLANLRNASTMKAFWLDVRAFMQRAATSTPVILQVEPDLWGYAQQSIGSLDDASHVPVKVSGSGVADLAGLPDTMAGFAQAFVRLRDIYAPNVLLGYHLSWWGTNQDPFYGSTSWSAAQIDALAARSAAFYRSLGTAFDVAFAEFSDRDAAFKQLVYGDGGASWWDAADFANHVRYLRDFSMASRLRLIPWQIPMGNQVMRAMNDTWGHYQDNRAEWLLGPSSAAHLADYADAGVIAFLFGGGAGGTTCACDAQGDGVTDPAPIDGNTTASYSADDDGGYLKHQAAAYYTSGAIALPAGAARIPSTRLAGPDRYATAAAISAATFAPGVSIAYVASGTTFPDALAGAPAAAHEGGPVLLVTRDSVPAPTSTELARLRPGRIVVLGGPGAVSDTVRGALAAFTDGGVSRLSGADRYETAAAISKDAFAPGVPVAFVATGTTFPDALAGAAVAGHVGGPVLLTQPTALPPATRAALVRLAPGQIVVLGGTASVSDAVLATLHTYTAGAVTRLAGPD